MKGGSLILRRRSSSNGFYPAPHAAESVETQRSIRLQSRLNKLSSIESGMEVTTASRELLPFSPARRGERRTDGRRVARRRWHRKRVADRRDQRPLQRHRSAQRLGQCQPVGGRSARQRGAAGPLSSSLCSKRQRSRADRVGCGTGQIRTNCNVPGCASKAST